MALLWQRQCSLWWILWGSECDSHLKWQNGLVVTEVMFPLANPLRKSVYDWHWKWQNGLVTEAMFPLGNYLRKSVWLALKVTKWPCCDRGVHFGKSIEESVAIGVWQKHCSPLKLLWERICCCDCMYLNGNYYGVTEAMLTLETHEFNTRHYDHLTCDCGQAKDPTCVTCCGLCVQLYMWLVVSVNDGHISLAICFLTQLLP
jgi:hypothetical protein